MSENVSSESSSNTEDEESSIDESEDESSGEDLIEQASFVQAYSNEPLASDSDESEPSNVETDDEDGIPSATIAQRFDRVVQVDSWCQCGSCSDDLPVNAREFRCCMEIGYCLGKFTFEGKEPSCITQHWEYAPITHKAVLKNVGTLLTTKSGKRYKQKNQNDNDYYRAVAYRWIIRWLCGFLGWDNSRPLPACVYNHIRKQYPSMAMKGFKTSNQRE